MASTEKNVVTSPTKQAGKTAKFKSAADADASGVNKANEWKQPLRRHINATTQKVEFVTILVRVLNGEAEHDFHARFSETVLRASTVCKAIAEKEQLTPAEAPMFSLWVISKDLEIQMRPDQDIFGLMVFWNKWMMKYTHFPEAENPQHPVNRHWFVYRREASITIQEERKLAANVGMSLLFGEAKRNLLTKRYVCTQMEAATIAGLQLQIAYGDYDAGRCKQGYLVDDNRLEQLLPIGMPEKMRASQWEEIITVQYKSFLGASVADARLQFLDFVRNLPCYGCSIFPVCAELPPSGFFEYRTQNWFLGAGPNGIAIMDFETQKYIHVIGWKEVYWRTGPDQLHLTSTKNGKAKEIVLITPQHVLIDNLCKKLKYKWAKETGLLEPKKSKTELQEVVIHKTAPAKEKKQEPVANIKKHGGSLDNLKGKATVLQRSMEKLADKMSGKSSEKISQEQILNAKKSQNSIVSQDKLKDFIPETILPKDYKPVSAPNSPKGDPRKSRMIEQKTAMSPTPPAQSPETPKTPRSVGSDKPLLNQYSPQVNRMAARARQVRQTEDEKQLLNQLEGMNPSSPFSSPKVQAKPTLQINDQTSPAIPSAKTDSPASVTFPEPQKAHSRVPSEAQTHERSGSLGTYVKAGRTNSKSSQPGAQINKRSSVLFGFDDHLGGIGPTQLIDKRKTIIKE